MMMVVGLHMKTQQLPPHSQPQKLRMHQETDTKEDKLTPISNLRLQRKKPRAIHHMSTIFSLSSCFHNIPTSAFHRTAESLVDERIKAVSSPFFFLKLPHSCPVSVQQSFPGWD